MSKNNAVHFKMSLVAAAVLSLSACSTTTPRVDNNGLSRVGDSVRAAGRTTAEVSSRAWNKAAYLLGFSDEDGESISDEGLLMDAESVALLEDEVKRPRDAVVRPIVIRSATPIEQDQTPINEGQSSANSDTSNQLASQSQQTPINAAQTYQDQAPTSMAQPASPLASNSQQSPTATQPLTNASSQNAFAPNDIAYEVAANETLWDIAKKTTGDANNWHVLADTNNLGPSASVFPGQQLIIPGDMAKPSYHTPQLPSDTQLTTLEPTDTQNLTTIPGNQVVATAEPSPQPISGKPFKVNAGETLWDFAKRITGDATNWRAIAGENNFTDKQASYVRTGQTIYVPEVLIQAEAELEAAQPIAPAQLTQPQAEQLSSAQSAEAIDESSQAQTPDDLSITVISTATTASRTNNDTNTIESDADSASSAQPVKIIEATFKTNEALATLQPPSNTNSESPTEIMVSGTYYPKAVYNEADFSSSLLMRVSPGTTLQVSKTMGSWYQVKTDKGFGYVHQRDIR